MAVTDLGLQLPDYRDFAAAELFSSQGGYSALDTGEKSEIDRLILRAERTLWFHPPVDPPIAWSCLRDPGLLDLWPDVAVSASITVTATYSAPNSTVTASVASFYETMIGKSIVITGIGTFTVTGWTSSTVITVSGNATCTAKTFSMASDGVFRLPSDFESPDSSTIVLTSTAGWYPDIELINEKEVVRMRASDTSVGYPRYAAIRWVPSDGSAAHAQELVTYPEPNVHYSVALPYVAQPQGMTLTTNPYPRGGPEMADCLLSVLLAVCEETRLGKRGGRWEEAAEKCRIAAKRDRSRHHNFVAGRMRPDAGLVQRGFDVKRLILPTA